MDEGDEYVPQMSQMADYTMAQMGGPQAQQQRYPPPGMPMNPYEQQQHMMMMQQQHMHMAGQQQQQPQAPAQPPPPAKKPRGKSKKAQAAEAAAAAAAAAAANQMDPMASMAAMSNNPMMRQNAYPNQMGGMYGAQHYQGANGQAQQGYRPGPASGAQAQYTPQNYQHMYQQQQRASQAQQAQAPPGYPYGGYPPQTSTGYPPQPQSQYTPQAAAQSHMRQQYAAQQAPPGYWEGYPGYGNPAAVPQQSPAAPPATSQPMAMNPQQDQWNRGSNEIMGIIKQLENSATEIKNRMQQVYNMPRNAAADQEIAQLQHKLGLIQNDIYRYQQQLHHMQYQMAGAANAHLQPQVPPASQTAMPTQHHGMPPTSAGVPPVHVNQSGNQVQLNITAADKSRTLISVYHEGYAGGSGASSTESKESIVPPEPTPSIQQQPPPQEPVQHQAPPQQHTPQTPQTPQVKMEQQPPSYNGVENGVSGSHSNPYAHHQMYGQYPNQHQQAQQQHQHMSSGYPSHSSHHQQPPQQQQYPPGYGMSANSSNALAPEMQMSSQMPQEPVAATEQSQQSYSGYPDYAASSSSYPTKPHHEEAPVAESSHQSMQSPPVADPSSSSSQQNEQQTPHDQPLEEKPTHSHEASFLEQQQSTSNVVESMPFTAELIQDEAPNPENEPVTEQQPEISEQAEEIELTTAAENTITSEETHHEEAEAEISSNQVHNNGSVGDIFEDNLNFEVAQEEEVESEHDVTMENGMGEEPESYQKQEVEEEEKEEEEEDDKDEEYVQEEKTEDEEEEEEEVAKVKQASSEDRETTETSEEPDDLEDEIKTSRRDLKEEEDDDVSSVATKDDFKDMSEEPAPSETNDGFTEPSTPATPVAAPTKKKSCRRPPVAVAKAKKKKSADDSDDDDFYPSRGKKKKGGGGSRKKPELIGEDSLDGEEGPGSDDEFLIKVDAPVADPNALVVEKILNLRMHMRPVVKEEEEEKEEMETGGAEENGEAKEEKKPEQKEEGKENEEKEVEMEEVEEFLIKWKGRSYVHCEWKTFAELLEIDKRVDGKIKRFKAKKMMSYIEDDEDFNSNFVIVDRVIDSTTEDDGQEFVLVKWKSLGYDEVTWEPVESVPADKVETFRQRQIIDTMKIKEKIRPEANEWQKMSMTKTWKNGNSLREYQFEGVDWLLYCYYNSQNCILADEMGLGKTVQTITFLSQVYDYGVRGPFLIVVPLSTIQNWVREFETWTDMNAVVYHGSAYAREVLQQHEIFYDKRHSGSRNWRKNFVKLDALITTFETVVSDVEFLKKIPWRVCVIDEAHRLKNRNCKLLVNGLLAFRMEHRVLLTGTPLQNNIEELFSLLNFLHPQQFNNSVTFLEQFGSCQTDDQVQKLQEILRPMMLRRLKEDVEKSLGPKEETIIEVQLSDMQKKFYRAILERNFSHLCKGTSAPSLMNVMMELRKCCNHPFLINGAEETIMNDFRAAHPDWDEETLAHKALVQASGKVVLIEKLLPKLRKDGHKVLIFSQMVKVLDLLEEFLISMSYPFERIDGNVRGDLRQAAIDRFSKENSDRFVFLLCTRAGGLGINLTAADTVIIFDSDWNPQNDLQAQARCHRIGQKKLVKVYRLITSNTYEREMFDKASLKLGLDKAVLQSTTALKAEGTALSKKDVEELLKKGAYGSIMDEENESAKFNEEDIETILQRRTQTITLEAGQKGSLFAKASFNSTHNKGDDIDIDDPEFWTKWAEKAQVDVEKATATPDGRELIIEEPRKRTKRFEGKNMDDEESDGSDGSGKKKRGPPGSNRKRRKDDEDGDYSSNYKPDELASSKAEFFKVEKVLAQYGWGRWAEIKKFGELENSEVDIEHISRTMLLHCIREFRGDDRIRQFVFNMIKPQGVGDEKKKSSGPPGNAFTQGWAALPEYNPPGFAMDASYNRHIHRHANKLLLKMDMMKHLETHIIGDERNLVEDPTVKWTDIKLKEMPKTPETLTEGWDDDCDKCFLIGCWRHGLENYDTMRADETLCFHEKTIPNWPGPTDFWTRFRRLMGVSQRSVHDPVYEKLKWSKREEQEFMRVLRSFGIKEIKPGPGVDWTLFRGFSPALEKKPDTECHEQLMCVLAMCNRAQGGTDMKPIDVKRAMSVDPMSGKRAGKLLNRLHLMRKVHTLAVHLEVAEMGLIEITNMPAGWTTQADKELIEICDQYGLDSLAANVLNKPAFSQIVRPSETTLLRRVLEIVGTIEAGKWCGSGDVETVNDSEVDEKKAAIDSIAQVQAQFLRLQQQQQQAANAAASASARKGGSSRKRPNNEQENNKRVMQQLSQMLGGLVGGTQSGQISQQDYATMITLMLMPQMIPNAQNMTAQQQQQLSQMLALLLAASAQQQSASATPAATSSSSKSSNSNSQAAATQAAAVAALAQASASSEAAQQEAILQTLLAMSMNPAALAAMTGQSTSASSTAATPARKAKPTPKEATPSTSSATSSLAAQAAALAAEANKKEENDILKTLEKAGVDYVALNQLNLLPKDAKLPMINKTTKETLPEAKRPQIRDLTSFVKSNPDWILDNQTFNEMLATALCTTGIPSARPSAAATPVTPAAKTETKPSQSSTPTPTASATVNIKVGASLQLDDMVSVFNRKTGEVLGAAKWPKAKELATWLDANPDFNVHPNSAAIAQLSLGNLHGDRIGGAGGSADGLVVPTTSSAIPSNAPTPAPPLTPSTPSATATANAAAIANAQLIALAAASAQAQQQQLQQMATPTSSRSKASQAAAAAAAAASQQEALKNQQQMELMQMQLLMQYQQTAALQAMLYGGYMPSTSAANSTASAANIAAMVAAAQASQTTSTPTPAKQTRAATSSTPSSSAAATSAAATAAASAAAAQASANSLDDLNPMLVAALLQNPAVYSSMMSSQDQTAMLALLAHAQAQAQSQPAAKKSKHP